MTYRITRDFNSSQQRFRAGNSLSGSEDLSPHTIETAAAAGLIVKESDKTDAPVERAVGDDE